MAAEVSGTMRYEIMVCTRCNLMPSEIKPVVAPDVSAKATIKVDKREPLTTLVIPHRSDCVELQRTPKEA